MKKIGFILIVLATTMVARAFDFSAEAPTGQTLYYQITSASTVKVVNGDSKPQGRLTIPSTVQGYSVTEIGQMALSNCYQLTSVVVPGSVTTIGMRAFAGDEALTSAYLSEGVQSIGMMAFSSCTALDTLVLPSSLTAIAVGTLGNTAYINNPDNWDNSVLYVGRYLIAARSILEGDLIVPDTIEGIANDAFDYCHISQITLPATLRFIGEFAFKDCPSLDTVRLNAAVPPTLGEDAFQNTPAGLTIVVPCDNLAAYQSAPRWSSLHVVGIGCPPPSGIDAAEGTALTATVVPGGIRVDAPRGTLLTVSDAMGRRVAAAIAADGETFISLPATGIYLVTASDGTSRKVLYFK